MANRKSCYLGLAYYSVSHNYKKSTFHLRWGMLRKKTCNVFSCKDATDYCPVSLRKHECVVQYQVEGSTVKGAATSRTTMEQQQSNMYSPAGQSMRMSQSGRMKRGHFITREENWTLDLISLRRKCISLYVWERHPPCWAWPQPKTQMSWNHQDSSGPER